MLPQRARKLIGACVQLPVADALSVLETMAVASGERAVCSSIQL